MMGRSGKDCDVSFFVVLIFSIRKYLQKFKTIHNGHINVQENQIRTVVPFGTFLVDNSKCLFTILGYQDFIRNLEATNQSFSEVVRNGIIIYKQDKIKLFHSLKLIGSKNKIKSCSLIYLPVK